MATVLTATEKRRLLQPVISLLPDDKSIVYPNYGLETGRFPIKVTAYDSGTGYYTWIEQSYDGAGNYIDAPNAATGSPTQFPAVERNGYVITNFPVRSQAWVRSQSETLGSIFEFDAGAESVVIPTLTVSKTGGTTVTNVTTINVFPSGSPIQVSGTTGTVTISIDDASATLPGVVNTGTQTFAGNKTFAGITTFNTVSGQNIEISGASIIFSLAPGTPTFSWNPALSQFTFQGGDIFVNGGVKLGGSPSTLDMGGLSRIRDGLGNLGLSGDYLTNAGSGVPQWTTFTGITSITGTGISSSVSGGVATLTLGNITPTTVNGLAISSPGGKTLTVSNTLTFSGTDGSAVNFGTGGTVHAVAYSGSASDLTTGTLPTAQLPAFSSSQITATAGTGSLSIVNGSVTNANLANSTITINGTPVSLGGSISTSSPAGSDPTSISYWGAL